MVVPKLIIQVQFEYAQVAGPTRIAASTVIPESYNLSSVTPGSLDEVLHEFEYFVESVQDAIEDCPQIEFLKYKKSGIPSSVSRYLSFAPKTGEEIYNFAITLGLSNHPLPAKWQERAKQHSENLARDLQKLTGESEVAKYKIVRIVVNDARFGNYEDAFDSIMEKIKSLKAFKYYGIEKVDLESGASYF